MKGYKLVKVNFESLVTRRFRLKYNIWTRTFARKDSLERGFGLFVFDDLDMAIKYGFNFMGNKPFILLEVEYDTVLATKWQIPMEPLELYGYETKERIPVLGGKMVMSLVPQTWKRIEQKNG